jgi:AcrR family transcriptional regulator
MTSGIVQAAARRERGARRDVPPSEATPTETRERLLDVAERLFAEHGIEKVSVREIVRESGQRNVSAARYHFGSRDALIAALVERRIRLIDAMRDERLDALLAAGEPGVRDLVLTSLLALADAVRLHPWGPFFVRVSAQALSSPQVELARRLPRDATRSLARVKRLLRPLLPALPEPVFGERMRIVNHQATYCVADWIRAHGAVRRGNAQAFESMVRDTADFLSAGLAAPVGPPVGAPSARSGGAR